MRHMNAHDAYATALQGALDAAEAEWRDFALWVRVSYRCFNREDVLDVAAQWPGPVKAGYCFSVANDAFDALLATPPEAVARRIIARLRG
jgi:hypothetical protein